jgi:tRNA-specific 2-thiouridylase
MVKVAVAMSGGVDSSMAAVMLKEEGHEVFGVTMRVGPPRDGAGESGGQADGHGQDVVSAARRIAHRLDIPHHVVDLRGIFNEKVIADFCREYSRGRTPNPCVRCNEHVKFGALLTGAVELGADLMATGHYARIERDETDGRYLLLKGVDRRKDQSYVLAMLRQEQLRRIVMPLGCLTKAIVEQRAREYGLTAERQKESQDICFIPDGDYGRFLKDYIPEAFEPGPILDREGNVLGEHRGIPFCTIGQRKGFGMSFAEPLYVNRIDAERNAVIVGSKEEAYSDELIASHVNWVSGGLTQQQQELKVKIRYRHREADAVVTPLPENEVARVKFRQPQTAITPGQAVVFYDGDVVIGGGTIEQAL